MKSLNKKKALRKVNKVAKQINDGILKDSLWRGRFYIHQEFISIYPYPDRSGLDGIIIYKYIDLKTGYSKLYKYELIDFNSPWSHKIWWDINNFIVEECEVWEKEGRELLYNDKVVYRTSNAYKT